MRFAFSSLLTFVTVASGAAARATAPLHTRSTTDVCADVDAELAVPFLGVNVNIGLLSGYFNLARDRQ